MGTAVAVLNLWCSTPTCAISPTQMQSVTVYSGPCVMAPISSDAPLYHVVGRVLNDLTGLPVRGATVSLNGVCGMAGTNGRNEEDHLRLQIVTDQDGEFIFDNIPAMAINLSASHNDYLQVFTFRRTADDPIGTYVIGRNTGTITLRIAPAGSISGVARDEQDRPMLDARITLQRFRTWSGWRGLEYSNTVKAESLTTPAVSRVFFFFSTKTRTHFSVGARTASFSAASVHLYHPNLLSPFTIINSVLPTKHLFDHHRP